MRRNNRADYVKRKQRITMKQFLATTALVLSLAAAPAFAETKGADRHAEGKARVEAAIAKLPADKAALVKTYFETQKTNGKASFEQTRALRKEMREMLTAPQFDKEAYLAKSRQVQELQAKSQSDRAQALADVASKLNQQERAALMDAMKPHKGGHRGKHEQKGAPPAPEVNQE